MMNLADQEVPAATTELAGLVSTELYMPQGYRQEAWLQDVYVRARLKYVSDPFELTGPDSSVGRASDF
ncbi:hypothetical protein DMN91_000706 [Ooceraea biroi]|uniref:Uncharacterized protein n=1 Tax=Ooceraea biroi TaxID=2015173 RepID=A0A3L8E4K0_OOCBI|nr:hypothetical protein DMN91_000706 [Ooceraea biroi]